eukprot:m.132970 g.132970  ORF g.132970 m.132970 type:complete len:177 (+) comp38088_c0_seq1:1029-1559(+)
MPAPADLTHSRLLLLQIGCIGAFALSLGAASPVPIAAFTSTVTQESGDGDLDLCRRVSFDVVPAKLFPEMKFIENFAPASIDIGRCHGSCPPIIKLRGSWRLYGVNGTGEYSAWLETALQSTHKQLKSRRCCIPVETSYIRLGPAWVDDPTAVDIQRHFPAKINVTRCECRYVVRA